MAQILASEHPLAPPTLTGNTVSVDVMLKQPTRITKMIMDLTLQRFIADRIFSNGGSVTGGAVIFDKVTSNQLYSSRDVQRVEPGDEFPIVTSDRLAPSVALVNKWGGKTFITLEAQDRNDTSLFTNRVRQLSNTIVRKINQVAIETLEAAVTASSRTVTGNNWSTVVVGGSSQSNQALWPAADFAKAAQQAEQEELGVKFDLWIINPAQYTSLINVYGAANLPALLDVLGVEIYVSNRVPAGTAYVVASGQVGQMRVEQPLKTETWYEEKTQRNWVQSSVRPVMFVDNPYAVLKFTGL